MTRVIVNPGICGFVAAIEVSKIAKRKFRVVITSDCETITKLGESLAEADQWDALKQYTNEIHKAASKCHLHATCPIPVAILKAIEVEAKLALPRDVTIQFKPTEH